MFSRRTPPIEAIFGSSLVSSIWDLQRTVSRKCSVLPPTFRCVLFLCYVILVLSVVALLLSATICMHSSFLPGMYRLYYVVQRLPAVCSLWGFMMIASMNVSKDWKNTPLIFQCGNRGFTSHASVLLSLQVRMNAIRAFN